MRTHPLAWSAWGGAAMVAALVDRNPLLQALLLLIVGNVLLLTPHALRSATRLLPWLVLLPATFSFALSRFGSHPLFSLPPLPLLGGPWTLEALLFGLSTGTALMLTVTVLAILQARLRPADVLRLLPHPLYRLGGTIVLALALVPQVSGSVRAVREARALRGHRTGWRAAPAFLLPVLLTALERALQYGESLDARGFASRRRTSYRPARWAVRDATMAGAAALAGIGIILGAPVPFNPYLRLAPDLPSLLAIAALLPLSIPAWLTRPKAPHAADLT